MTLAFPKPVKRPKSPPKRLQRKSRLNPKSKTKKASNRRDSAYRRWVKTLPCIVCGNSPVDPSHVACGPNEKGTALKVDDRQCVPHCRPCHEAWEERRWPFDGKTKQWRWEQAIEWVAKTQLKAIPEDYDQAIHFEAAGLGRIVSEPVEGCWGYSSSPWYWLPGNGS